MQNTVKYNGRFEENLEQIAVNHKEFRVLVVDDELSILELVKTALETLENYDVEVASSAADALEWVMDSEESFDCFLLDIQMPEIDGIELLKQIRVLPEYADTPILMLTAMSDRKYIDNAFLEGASDYVNKPFDFLELRSRIKRAHREVEYRRVAEGKVPATYTVARGSEQERELYFEDPLSLEGVKHALRYTEFDNYVAQLKRIKLFNSRAISIMLHDARAFYDHAGCSAFRSAIRKMASGIERTIQELDCVFSYRGAGVFLVIIHGREFPDSVADHISLGDFFGSRTRKQINDDCIKVVVGDVVPLRVLSRSSAAHALQTAIATAQHLENELRRTHEYEDNLGLNETIPPQTKARRNIYEKVLNELYGEESYLRQR